MARESLVTKRVVRYLDGLQQAGHRVEWMKVKGGAAQKRGEADFFVTYEGRTIRPELKGDGGKVSELQDHRLNEWQWAGAICFVAFSFREFKIQFEKAIRLIIDERREYFERTYGRPRVAELLGDASVKA